MGKKEGRSWKEKLGAKKKNRISIDGESEREREIGERGEDCTFTYCQIDRVGIIDIPVFCFSLNLAFYPFLLYLVLVEQQRLRDCKHLQATCSENQIEPFP